MSRTCPDCEGTGDADDVAEQPDEESDECPNCGGTGFLDDWVAGNE